QPALPRNSPSPIDDRLNVAGRGYAVGSGVRGVVRDATTDAFGDDRDLPQPQRVPEAERSPAATRDSQVFGSDLGAGRVSVHCGRGANRHLAGLSPVRQGAAHIGQRVTQSRQFPIENRSDVTGGTVDDDVTDVEVTMDQTDLTWLGQVLGQERCESVEIGSFLGPALHELAAPPLQLPRRVGCPRRQLAKADSVDVDGVDLRLGPSEFEAEPSGRLGAELPGGLLLLDDGSLYVFHDDDRD